MRRRKKQKILILRLLSKKILFLGSATLWKKGHKFEHRWHPPHIPSYGLISIDVFPNCFEHCGWRLHRTLLVNEPFCAMHKLKHHTSLGRLRVCSPAWPFPSLSFGSLLSEHTSDVSPVILVYFWCLLAKLLILVTHYIIIYLCC